MAEDMCSGEENRLLDCNIEPFIRSQLCDHSHDVGLRCGKYMALYVCVCEGERADSKKREGGREG